MFGVIFILDKRLPFSSNSLFNRTLLSKETMDMLQIKYDALQQSYDALRADSKQKDKIIDRLNEQKRNYKQ